MWGNRTIRRNIGVLTIAQSLSLVCAVATAALLGRALGPAHYGILGFGIACLSFLGIAVTIGTDTYGVREVARDPACAGVIIGRVMGLRLVLAAAAFAVFLVFLAMQGRSSLETAVLFVQGLGVLIIALTVDYAFQGLQRMEVNGLRQVVTAGLTLGGVALLVRQPGDVIWAAAIVLAAGLASVAGVLAFARRTLGSARPRFAMAPWRGILAVSLPMAVSGVTTTLMSNTDMVMLGLMRSNAEVGLYAAAFRIMAVALVPGGLILTAFFPTLAVAFREGRAVMHERATALSRAAVMVGAPVCIGGMLFADVLLRAVYGDGFAEAAPVLAVLLAGVFAWYLRLAFDPALPAWNAERTHMKIMLGGAALNVALNLVLIPRHGVMGAAAASLVSHVLVLAGMAWAFRRLTGRLIVAPAVGATVCVLPAAAAALAFRAAVEPAWTSPLAILVVGGGLFGAVYIPLFLLYRWRAGRGGRAPLADGGPKPSRKD